MKTLQLFNTIVQSEVFVRNGSEIDLCQALIDLCDSIKEEEETNWCMGEGGMVCLSDLIPGAYWALAEWHGGQASESYKALCSLGTIFKPGMSSAPKNWEDDTCFDAYESIYAWFETNN
jgi:hypothetical protein